MIQMVSPRCPSPPRNRYQQAQNYRATVRSQQIVTSYRHQRDSKPINMNGPREPVVVGSPKNPQTTEGKIVTGLINAVRPMVRDKVNELQLSVSKVETVNTNGYGTSSTKTDYVFSGPDAAKLESMESVYQGELRSQTDSKFSAFASESLGKDFSSLSPEEQQNFKMENSGTYGLMMSVTASGMGPSPKQQVVAETERMTQHGVLVEEKKKRDLPTISQGN